MKCPMCGSKNVSVHVRNQSRVWCRACGDHFTRDIEMERFIASVTGLLGAVERLIEAQEEASMPEMDQELFDGVVKWVVMEIQGEYYYEPIEALTTAKMGYEEPDLGGKFGLWNDEMSRIQARVLRAAADRLDPKGE